MNGWVRTTFGNRPAIRRRLFGTEQADPGDVLHPVGYEVIQLDEGEFSYWRILGEPPEDRPRFMYVLDPEDAALMAPEYREEMIDQLERSAKNKGRTVTRKLEHGIALLQEGKYEEANNLLDDLMAWTPELAMENAEKLRNSEPEDTLPESQRKGGLFGIDGHSP